MLFNLSKQYFGYKENLFEPFTITELFKANYERIENSVKLTKFERLGYKWFDDKRTIKTKFVNLIKNDHNYMMKLFPIDIEPEIIDMLETDFDVICLERRDKLHQVLSWILLWETNIAHYKIDDNRTVKTITYNPFHAREMIRHLKAYTEFKRSFKRPYKLLIYEDFMELGGNEDALIKLLDLPIYDYIKLDIPTKPTPYERRLEDMINNKEEWIRDKPYLIETILKVIKE